jgi:hypothetical protein
METRKPRSVTLDSLSLKGEWDVSQDWLTVSNINSASIAKPTPNRDSQELFMGISLLDLNTLIDAGGGKRLTIEFSGSSTRLVPEQP